MAFFTVSNRRHPLAVALSALFVTMGLAAAPPALAEYPERAITLIVPFAAKSSPDLLAQAVAARMEESFGQKVEIENIVGEGGNRGIAAAARAKPDGYTLVIAGNGPLSINKHLFKALPYDPDRDLLPIVGLAAAPNYLVVAQRIPVKTVDELLGLGTISSSPLRAAIAGFGTSQHLSGEVLRHRGKIGLAYAEFSDISKHLDSLRQGQSEIGFVQANGVRQLGDSVRVLATTAPRRTADFPHVPTFLESGLDGPETSGWFALVAPAGTSPEIAATLEQAMLDAFRHDAFLVGLRVMGFEPTGEGQAALKAKIAADSAKMAKVIADLGTPKR